MKQDSAVAFSTTMRIHLALSTRDLAAATAFYRVLFDAEPTKVKPDYVKFEVESPPVNLTLNLGDEPVALPAAMHFGVQVKATSAVAAALQRFTAHGLATRVEEKTTCCYAVQNKFWVVDPDQHPWEIFVVTDAAVDVHRAAPPAATSASGCCVPSLS
jgi:catechol 2,3-dioxygenase-like lactoylglutathione lyase family enzyme